MEAICGIIGKRDNAAVKAMANALKHRGHSIRLLEGDDFTVASSQPDFAKNATTPSGPLCLLDGSPFLPDTGLASPAAFQQHCAALKAPERLNVKGAFAAAVRVGKDWWLVRDRLGIKPLYYAHARGCIVFASELKAILASGCVQRHLNLASVDRYLTLRCVPGKESIVQGVYRVEPGHVVTLSAGAVASVPFAAFDFTVRPTTRTAAGPVLREGLKQSLARSATTDVMWSAGIDCAALAALMPESKAHFVLLKSAWQAEARGARESARMLDVPLRVHKAPALTANTFAKAAYHLDEPVADAAVLPLYMIGQQLAADGTRFISGHGADEMFGGYPRFNIMQKARGARGIVPVNFLAGITPSLPPNAFVRRAGRYLSSIRDDTRAYLSLIAVFDAEERQELYTGAMKAAIHEKGDSLAVLQPHFTGDDLARSHLFLDLNVALPDLLLLECDRIMAAHGIALDFPFLSDDVLDFAISLPSKVKYGVRSKPLLRQTMRHILPARIRLRARRGFTVPQSGPALRVIDNAAREIMSQERVESAGLFRWPFVANVLATAGHNVYRRRQFWALLMFFAWYREFMEV